MTDPVEPGEILDSPLAERLLRSDVYLICDVEVGGVAFWLLLVHVLVDGLALCGCGCDLVSYQ